VVGDTDGLCATIGCDPEELVSLARSAPHSRSTSASMFVSELCFCICRFLQPPSVMDRRRGVVAGDIDASLPLMAYFRGTLAMGDEEWAEFKQALSTPLPMTLRVHCSERALRSMAFSLLEQPPLGEQTAHPAAKVLAAVRRVPVAQNATALDAYGCTHQQYHENPEMVTWCRCLHAASAVSFQELVSMLPVAALGIERTHRVLDMCAAPGSKSLQAIDATLRDGWLAARESVVVLNEKDKIKATQTLPARVKRYHAPNGVVTRCDGTQLPQLYVEGRAGTTPSAVRFDRVICDVPCSGDGTVRKERSLLASWSDSYVDSLAVVQKRLLKRALDLTAVGGLVAYSTCSLNVKEDEDVVADALRTYGGSVELVDINAVLRQQGLRLHSSGGRMPSEHVENSIPSFDHSLVLRVLPHKDDSGGFFVALLRKVSEPAMTAPVVTNERLNRWADIKRWREVDVLNDMEWASITRFFGMATPDVTAPRCGAPSERFDRFHGLCPVYHLNPNGGPMKRIVLCTPGAAAMLFLVRPFKGPGVEVVALGIRALEKYDGEYLAESPCRWRVAQEGASFVAQHATRRRLLVDADASPWLKDLMENGHVPHELCHAQAAEHSSVVGTSLTSFLRTGLGSDLWVDRATAGEGSPIEDRDVAPQLATGCVLLGVHGGQTGLSPRDAWWLSATLSASKIELTVDRSMRDFGGLLLFGVMPPIPGAA
jgi:16S rRNA C967 or C1407 C5-methylase (RsmB/RsmF family)